MPTLSPQNPAKPTPKMISAKPREHVMMKVSDHADW
jgi:hypothetical protein